jgi:hypothetical protein
LAQLKHDGTNAVRHSDGMVVMMMMMMMMMMMQSITRPHITQKKSKGGTGYIEGPNRAEQ